MQSYQMVTRMCRLLYGNFEIRLWLWYCSKCFTTKSHNTCESWWIWSRCNQSTCFQSIRWRARTLTGCQKKINYVHWTAPTTAPLKEESRFFVFVFLGPAAFLHGFRSRHWLKLWNYYGTILCPHIMAMSIWSDTGLLKPVFFSSAVLPWLLCVAELQANVKCKTTACWLKLQLK